MSAGIKSNLSHSTTRVCLLSLAAACGFAVATTAGAAEPGVWHSHKLRFNYLGFTATYSCDGLKTNLDALLRESGAGQKITVTPGPCANGFGTPEKLLHAELNFSTLIPAGAAGSAAGNGSGTSGSWQHVTFRPRDVTLQGGNCELVQEFKEKVLPLFATRNIKAILNCVPHQATGNSYSLSFDVFAPADAKLPTNLGAP